MQSTQPVSTLPARIGLGTWEMGVSSAQRQREIAAITHALDYGYRLIDTAEMYAKGGAERVVGAALRSFGAARREQLFLVSKVLPDNASHSGCIRACEASIQRMQCDYLDLFLLHWPGPHRFAETLRGFSDLLHRGLIKNYGVSNLDLTSMQRWRESEDQLGMRSVIQCNQIYYSTEARGAEFDLLPWQRSHGIATMAYSPLGRGSLAKDPILNSIGAARDVTAAQIALAWCVRQADVVAIPKSVDRHRLEQNLDAALLRLSAAELASIDRQFPPPHSKRPLQTA